MVFEPRISQRNSSSKFSFVNERWGESEKIVRTVEGLSNKRGKILRLKSLILFLLGSFTGWAQADDAAMDKYRNYTPKQVQEMPQKKRDSSLPMAYLFAAQRGLSADSQLLFSMQLNQLMYPGVQDYKTAIKAFQSDLGDPPTGILTVYQIHQLEYRSDIQKLNSILFPEDFFNFKNSDYAKVEGAVKILDDKIAWPINRHIVKCFRSQKTCEVQQIILVIPDENSWTQRLQLAIDKTDYYNIVNWTEKTVDAELPAEPDSCRTVSLTLNFKTEEHFFITKNAGGNCEILGRQIDKLEKPRISQVVKGSEIFQAEFEKLRKKAYGFLASGFRKRLDSALNQQGSK